MHFNNSAHLVISNWMMIKWYLQKYAPGAPLPTLPVTLLLYLQEPDKDLTIK
jgi:hypothetical protein